MNRWVTPPKVTPKAVTSPSWSPPPPWKQAPGPFPSWKNFHNWRVFELRKPGYNKWRWDCLRGQNQNGGRQLTGEERYKTTFFRRYKPPNKRKCIRRDRLSGKWLFLWFEAFVSAEAFYDSLIHMYVIPVYLCGCRLHYESAVHNTLFRGFKPFACGVLLLLHQLKKRFLRNFVVFSRKYTKKFSIAWSLSLPLEGKFIHA